MNINRELEVQSICMAMEYLNEYLPSVHKERRTVFEHIENEGIKTEDEAILDRLCIEGCLVTGNIWWKPLKELGIPYKFTYPIIGLLNFSGKRARVYFYVSKECNDEIGMLKLLIPKELCLCYCPINKRQDKKQIFYGIDRVIVDEGGDNVKGEGEGLFLIYSNYYDFMEKNYPDLLEIELELQNEY